MEGYLGEFPLETLDATPFEDFNETKWAAFYIQEYGGIDGEHHKAWVLDQVMRIIKGTLVEVGLARWENGTKEYRFTTAAPSESYSAWRKWMEREGYVWDEGIAP